MKTYPVLTEEGRKTSAFEVEIAYIGSTTIALLLAGVDGVTDVQSRKIFGKSNDVHVEFKYLKRPFMVWEPYGDSSRYWIGPTEQAEGGVDAEPLENALRGYQPPLHRIVLGDVLSLRFITKLFAKAR